MGAIVALLVASGLLLAACGGSDGGDEGSSDTQAPTDVSAGDVDPNGIFRMGFNLAQQGGSGFFLDPLRETGDTNDNLFYLIYGRILRPTPEGDLVPDQAESTSIPDADTIEITLRPDQTFHDGTPFDAAAVKASLDRALASDNTAGLGDGFFDLESVATEGDLGLTLTIADGKAASWHDVYLGSWKTSVVPEGATFDPPVGAGPMQVTAWSKEQSMSLKTYDGYWDRAAIKVAGLELVHTAQGQEQAALAALQAWQFDLTQIDVPQMSAMGGSIESLVVADPSRLINMQICKRDGPLADPDVRRAYNMAIDREAISAAVYADTAVPGTTLWPEGHRFFDPDLGDVLAYDPEAAKQLLVDAGYPDGFSFDLYTLPALGLPDVAAVVKQQLAEIGVTVNIVPTSAIVNDFMTTGKPGMSLIPLMTAGIGKLTNWVGDGIANVCQYDDPELTSLTEQLEAVSESSDEAVELWSQIQDIVVNDALSAFVAFSSRLAAYDSDVVGDPVLYPLGTFPVPDFRITYVKAS
jgi:peptide/nickel transport system substrate-binding protein